MLIIYWGKKIRLQNGMHSAISFYGENLHMRIETALEACDQGVTGGVPGRWKRNTFIFVCPHF